VVAAHKNALRIIQITEFNRAATKFRDTFAEVIAVIKSRTKGDTPDADQLLESSFYIHLMAVNEFRHFLPQEDIAAFNKAWDEYHEINNEHNLKQYAEEYTGCHSKYPREPHLMAIERIENLLKYAMPK